MVTHCVVVPEIATFEHEAMLEYVEPLVDASKLTVPVPEAPNVAVIVDDVPTTTGDGGLATTLIELPVVPGVTVNGYAGLVVKA
jgi:hypothetical protein